MTKISLNPGLWIVFTIIMLSACGTGRPVLYPNNHFKDVGDEVAQTDIEECMQLADQQDLSTGQGTEMAKHTAVGAGAGAATGAIFGSAGSGAASGAIWGFISGLFHSSDADPVYQRFVSECLTEKGYKTVGWK